MDLFQSIILGILQGLTEFLPISSSGHILIVPALLGWDDPGTPEQLRQHLRAETERLGNLIKAVGLKVQ